MFELEKTLIDCEDFMPPQNKSGYERDTGIEPVYSDWQPDALPLC